MSGTSKTNNGPCRYCGRPILYLGALFCSPVCHFSALSYPPPTVGEEPAELVPDIVPDTPSPIVVFEAEEPVPDPVEEEPEPQSVMGFLEPPPDEPVTRKKLYL